MFAKFFVSVILHRKPLNEYASKSHINILCCYHYQDHAKHVRVKLVWVGPTVRVKLVWVGLIVSYFRLCLFVIYFMFVCVCRRW